jgi:hypothetical protein
VEIEKSKEDYADEDDISGMDSALQSRVFIEMEKQKADQRQAQPDSHECNENLRVRVAHGFHD